RIRDDAVHRRAGEFVHGRRVHEALVRLGGPRPQGQETPPRLRLDDMEIIKPGRQFDFMRWRWDFIGLSLTLLVLSVMSLWKPGPQLGTDFRGGTEVEVAFKQPVGIGEVRTAVEKLGFASPDIVAITDRAAHANQYLIRVQEVSALSEAQKDQIR